LAGALLRETGVLGVLVPGRELCQPGEAVPPRDANRRHPGGPRPAGGPQAGRGRHPGGLPGRRGFIPPIPQAGQPGGAHPVVGVLRTGAGICIGEKTVNRGVPGTTPRATKTWAGDSSTPAQAPETGPGRRRGRGGPFNPGPGLVNGGAVGGVPGVRPGACPRVCVTGSELPRDRGGLHFGTVRAR